MVYTPRNYFLNPHYFHFELGDYPTCLDIGRELKTLMLK